MGLDLGLGTPCFRIVFSAKCERSGLSCWGKDYKNTEGCGGQQMLRQSSRQASRAFGCMHVCMEGHLQHTPGGRRGAGSQQLCVRPRACILAGLEEKDVS